MINQNKNEDRKGNKYWNSYYKDDLNAIACFDGKNIVFKGTPKIVLRKGKSDFGDEILFQFLIKEKTKEYDSNSDHQVLEFYLDSKEGLQFLKDTIKFFEEAENGN